MPARERPFESLTPERVLNAIDGVGWRTTGTLLALNSYENRVFQIGVEADAGPGAYVVAKFYRAGRWTDAQILEEHAFAQELAGAEVPAVPPLAQDGRTLHRYEDLRFAVFPRRGGRAPNLDDRDTLRWLGRFLGRLHAVGARRPFDHRPVLDVETFGAASRTDLLGSGRLPEALADVYAGVSAQALRLVRQAFEGVAAAALRLHGDLHEGNVLWTDSGPQPGPHFVDLDDSRMGPAVQDLWMLLGSRDEAPVRLKHLLHGYEQFRDFDRRELALIEPLRTLRLMHYSAWIARRWDDPAFPAAFPWFDTPRYWEERILEMREQIAAMQEPALAPA